MKSLFNTPEVAKQLTATTDKHEQLTTEFWNMHTEKVASLKKLIAVPAKDQVTLLWTLNSFNAFTFIPFCLSHFSFIHELTISTYTINRRIADALVREVDGGRILKADILVSDSLRQRMPHVIDHLNGLLATRPMIQLHYGWNHSKITCCRCGDNYLVLEGSGNWGENAAHEQYVLFNSKKVYDFRKENIGMV